MQNKATNVLVFGGVGGIGEALARRLAHAGHIVTVTSRDLDRAQSLAQEIGGHAVLCDVLDEDQIKTAVAAAISDGRLSGLAYCVGSIALKPLARTSAEDFMTAFRLNVLGAALALREAAPALMAAGGAALLFSSVAAGQGFPAHAAIGAAKAGVEGLMRAVAAELAPKARINVIAPSLTVTPLAQGILANPKMAEGIAALHPLPRLGQADEMAALAAFLLSDETGWMTGQVIGVDGGRSTLRVGRG